MRWKSKYAAIESNGCELMTPGSLTDLGSVPATHGHLIIPFLESRDAPQIASAHTQYMKSNVSEIKIYYNILSY
jgi:hypothetical protein